MIDLRLLRESPDAVRASQRARGADDGVVDAAVAADTSKREALSRFESLRAQQKELGRQVATAQGDDKKARLQDLSALATQVKEAQSQANSADQRLLEVLMSLPNVIEPGVPAGGEEDYVQLRQVGRARDFAAEGMQPRDHVELGESLGAIDTIRGAKVSGARFYFLTGIGARLELAMLNMAMDVAMEAGFTAMITPTMVRPEIMAGTGFLGAHADEVYRLEADDLYLVGTSEVPLAGYHSEEILDVSRRPRRYAGWSACYRREAGSYGKDTRGIIRVHQFHKVEMFVYCDPAQAQGEHDRLLALEEDMLGRMDLPYRVIEVAAGDLGSSAARKYDCEAWLPSGQRWLELTSTSNCTTFQARRLGIRQRTGHGNEVLATLNGTLATTRWLVALLENHQQADGSVTVPPALAGYLGGMRRIQPAG